MFPLYTLLHNGDLTIVSLMGITTRRAETIVWCCESVTAPSYIHTKRCCHASLLTRSSYVHDHKGAYTCAYATIYCIFIVKPCCCSAPQQCIALQSTVTFATQLKQQQTVTEHKYTVNVTRIMHEQILISLPLRVQRSPLHC